MCILSGYITNSYAAPDSQGKFNVPAADIAHHEYDTKKGHSYILKSNDVFVAKSLRGKTTLQATLFSSKPMGKKEVIDKIVWVLKSTGVDNNYVARVKDKLPGFERTAQTSFYLPLIDNKGVEHHFRFNNSGDKQLYILDYQRSSNKDKRGNKS